MLRVGQQGFVKGNSFYQSSSTICCSDSKTNLPYLEKSEETNKKVKNICYCHCCVKNDPLVGSSLISQLSMHRQDIKMAWESEASYGNSCEQSSKVLGPPLHWVWRVIHWTSDVIFDWFEDHNSREKNYTDDTTAKKKWKLDKKVKVSEWARLAHKSSCDNQAQKVQNQCLGRQNMSTKSAKQRSARDHLKLLRTLRRSYVWTYWPIRPASKCPWFQYHGVIWGVYTLFAYIPLYSWMKRGTVWE